MELNTLDAFRGVIRQGETIALLPHKALIDSHNDPTLAVRPIAQAELQKNLGEQEKLESALTRQVVMVTTSDRLMIPPIAHFYKLVRNLGKSQDLTSVYSISN